MRAPGKVRRLTSKGSRGDAGVFHVWRSLSSGSLIWLSVAPFAFPDSDSKWSDLEVRVAGEIVVAESAEVVAVDDIAILVGDEGMPGPAL